MHSILMYGVMLISAIPCLFVLMRVDEQATEELGVQQVETAEQELVEGMLCSWSLFLPNHVLINHNDLKVA
jgi:predicted metal-binding membrane protein